MILPSFLLVFLSEMGDKTQLLTLILLSRFKKPWPILGGIFVATILNHALASYFGGFAARYIPPSALPWGLASLFFAFGLWLLFPDKDSELKPKSRYGAFLTTALLFFLAEMGDKTQLVTIALGAKADPLAVTVGSTLGMLAANGLALLFGARLLKIIPMNWVRVIACLAFLAFGIAILVQSRI